jgi:hypothetical protein
MENIRINNSNHANADVNTLRLFSINKVSRILGVRHGTVKKMIVFGKIAHIKINKRIKIPHINLMKFIEEQSIRNKGQGERFLSTEEISLRIDNLIAEYSGVGLN